MRRLRSLHLAGITAAIASAMACTVSLNPQPLPPEANAALGDASTTMLDGGAASPAFEATDASAEATTTNLDDAGDASDVSDASDASDASDGAP